MRFTCFARNPGSEYFVKDEAINKIAIIAMAVTYRTTDRLL
jgi:hypothetical protein